MLKPERISLVSVVCKYLANGKMLIKKVRAGTQCQWGGAMGLHGPTVYREATNEKYLFWAFTDLLKTYDTVDRHGMWQMQRVYGVGGNYRVSM